MSPPRDSASPDLWVCQLGLVPYQQAVEWIGEGLQPLGSEYVKTLRRGCLEERWVDIYPNQGKGAGAFSAGCPGRTLLLC